MTEQDALTHARELRRCMDSTLGLLERVCEGMPNGSDATTLRAHIEGGAPESRHLIDQVIAALGGPARDEDEALTKSFRRGYQIAALLAREDKTGRRDLAAWKEDPDVFWEREMEAAR
jgi:hypothetical protein